MTDRTFFDDVLVPVVLILVATAGMMYVVSEMSEARKQAAAEETRADSLQQVVERQDRRIRRQEEQIERLERAVNRRIDFMAPVMTGETRRPAEMEAVAWVIRHRAASERFPDTIPAVVGEEWAFTPVMRGLPEPTDTARSIARRVLLAPPEADPVQGATHFYSPRSMRPKWSVPRWARRYREVRMPEIPPRRFRFFRTQG